MNGWLTRSLRMATCLFVVVNLNFFLPRLMPGDPLLMLLGPDAVALSKKDHALLKKQYGLDRPLWGQYGRYWGDLAVGRLGFSFHRHESVGPLIAEHLARSLLLLLPVVAASTLAAALFGTLAGWRAGSAWDLLLTAAALTSYAMPAFLTAMLFLDFFGYRLGWFPLGGSLDPVTDQGVFAFLTSLAGLLRHLALPGLVLTLASAGAKFMVMRNAVAQAREESYVLYARAKGAAAWRVPLVHVFPNACLPLLHLAGLHLGFVVSGAVLVEIVFSLNGMGTLILDAALQRDYPVLQAAFLVLTLVVIGLSFLMDLVSGLIDPRVRA